MSRILHKIFWKRTLKLIAWFLVSLVGFFILLKLALHIPFVQESVKSKAVKVINESGYLKASIGELDINFPTTLVANSILINDLAGDTALSLDHIALSVKILPLLQKKLVVKNIVLENGRGYIHKLLPETGNEETPVAKDATPSDSAAWEVAVNRLSVDNCYFTYSQTGASGFNLILDLGNVKARNGTLDLEKLIYFSQLKTEDTYVTFEELSGPEKPPSDSAFSFADIRVADAGLEESGFFFVDASGETTVNITTGELQTNDLLVDVTREKVSIGKGSTRDLLVEVLLKSRDEEPEPETGSALNWGQYLYHVEGRQLKLDNANVKIEFVDEPAPKGHFDSNHLDLAKMNGTLADFVLYSDFLQITMKNFSGTDPNGLEIKQLNTRMRMDGNDFVVDQLDMETPSATYNARLCTNLSPTDYSDLSDKTMDLDLSIESQDLADLDFFYPLSELKGLPSGLKSTDYALKLKTSGSTRQLSIDEFDFRTLTATQLQFTGLAENLGDTAADPEFALENLHLKTVRNDMLKFIGNVPEPLRQLPTFIQLNGSYRLHEGRNEISADLASEFGHISVLKAGFASGQSINYFVENLSADLDQLDSLTDLGVSRVKLDVIGNVSGSGFSDLFADVKLKVDTLGYGQHKYRNINLDAKARDGILDASLRSLDPEAPVEALITGNFQNSEQSISAKLKVEGLDLYALGLVENDFSIYGKTGIDLAFSKPQNMDARLTIESLDFIKGDTTYNMHESEIALLSTDRKTRLTMDSHFYQLEFEAEDSYTDLARALIILPEYYMRENSDNPIPYHMPAYNIQGRLDYPAEFVNLLFPYLPAFEQLNISGSGVANGAFTIDASLGNLSYKSIQSEKLDLHVSGDRDHLRFRNSTDLKISQLIAGKLELESDVADAKWAGRLQYSDSKERKAFDLGVLVSGQGDSVLARIDTENLVLNYQKWQLDSAQSLVWMRSTDLQQGFLKGQFSIRNAEQNIRLVADRQDIELGIDTFDLAGFTHLLNDTLPIGGYLRVSMQNNLQAKSEKWDLHLSDLSIDSILLGQIDLLGESSEEHFQASLLAQNNIGKVGVNLQKNGEAFDYLVRIDNLNLETLHDHLLARESNLLVGGTINGTVEGSFGEQLRASGSLAFNNVNIEYLPYQLFLKLDRDTVKFSDEQILFRDFRLYDRSNQTLTVNGNLLLKSVPELDLHLSSESFLVFDNEDENLDIGGKLQIGTDLELTGNIKQTALKGYLNTLPGSFIRYKYKSNVMLDNMENVVTFKNFDADTLQSNKKTLVLPRNKHIDWDVDMNIQNTEVYILLFETSHDYVRLFASGQLNLQKGYGNKLMLYGELTSDNGSVYYDAPMVSSIDLKIMQASAKWEGDIDNPILNFKGYEVFRVSPSEVLSNMNTGNEHVPVTVYALAENTTLNNFDIHFDVESENGQLQKHFESLMASNREAYATNLLVFGTLEGMKGGGGNSFAQGVVSKLNEISRRNIRNADLSFYMDQSVNNANNLQSVKQVGYSFSKGLFSQRVRVSVGGDVKLNQDDVYDERMKTFNPFGNLQLDYIISRKPDLSINAIRRDIYKGAIDGQITESSLGVTYKKSFPNLFKKARKEDE